MKSIYDSGMPISFKGSMVLKACLIEAGYTEDIRHTFDIDANWYSDTAPTAEQMTSSLQKAIDRNDLNIDVKLSRMYGNGRSAGFRISDRSTGDELFTMDMDVNRPPMQTKMYEVDGLSLSGASHASMISDKIVAISSDKVFRRIKGCRDELRTHRQLHRRGRLHHHGSKVRSGLHRRMGSPQIRCRLDQPRLCETHLNMKRPADSITVSAGLF